MTRELQPCGTRAAYERHRRKREPTCDPCKAANRTDNMEIRAKHSRCRTRAHWRLVALHRAEFDRLLAEERVKEPGTDALSRTQQRALRRLARSRRVQFRALLKEELAKDGESR